MVTYHPVHEIDKRPECNCIILHNGVERGEKVAHALNIAQILVVFVVSKKHVLHLLEMHVCPDI